MEHIKQTFSRCKAEGRPALVGYVTAGYPTVAETIDILLGMEAGGADIIELGLPFKDPIGDGPTIQKANTVALANGVTTNKCLEVVRAARGKGLKVPVLFMGYYNPVERYGEEQLLRDARAAGVNGFIVVDLPPKHAVTFRNHCTKEGYVSFAFPRVPNLQVVLLL